MRCEEVRENFADYLIGALSDQSAEQVVSHLAGCGTCRAEAEDLGHVWEHLERIPEGPTDSPVMRARFDKMMFAHDGAQNYKKRMPSWQKPVVYAAVAALLVLMAFAGLRGIRWMTDRSGGAPSPDADAGQPKDTALPQPPARREEKRSATEVKAGTTTVNTARPIQPRKNVAPPTAASAPVNAPFETGEITRTMEAPSEDSRGASCRNCPPPSISLAGLIASPVLSALVVDAYVTDVSPTPDLRPNASVVRWRVTNVLKGETSASDITLQMGGGLAFGQRGFLFLPRDGSVPYASLLVNVDGSSASVIGRFRDDSARRRIEAMTPDQISAEIRAFSRVHPVRVQVHVEGDYPAELGVAREVTAPGLINSAPDDFRDRFAAMRVVATPADSMLGAQQSGRVAMLLNDVSFHVDSAPTPRPPIGRGFDPPPQAALPPHAATNDLNGILNEGLYRVSFDGIPFGYSMKSITNGRIDLLQNPLSIGPPTGLAAIAGSITVTLAPDSLARGVSVRGHVTGIPIIASSAVWVSMRSDAAEDIHTGAVAVETDGRFELSNVPPGRYVVRVHQSEFPAAAGWATTTARLIVGNADATLDMPIAVPGVQITGRVYITDRTGRARPIPNDNVFITHDRSFLPADRVKPDGTFALTLPAGDHLVGVSPLPLGYSLKSIRSGLTDLLRTPLNIGPLQNQPIEIKIEYEF